MHTDHVGFLSVLVLSTVFTQVKLSIHVLNVRHEHNVPEGSEQLNGTHEDYIAKLLVTRGLHVYGTTALRATLDKVIDTA